MSRDLTKSRRRVRIAFIMLVGLGIAVIVTSFPYRALSRQHAVITSLSSHITKIDVANKVLKEEAAQLENPNVVKELAVSQFGLNPTSSAVNRAPVVSGSPYGQPIHPVPLSVPPVLPGSALSNSLLGLPGAAPIQWSSSRVSALKSTSPSTSKVVSALRGVSASSNTASGDHGYGTDIVSRGNAAGNRSTSHQGFLHRLISSLEFWR
jgi:hypothetical protein